MGAVAVESKMSSTVDISGAVTTPNGLITPIVSNADQKTIPELVAVFRVSSGVQCCLTCDRNTVTKRSCIVRYVMLVKCGCFVSINRMQSC